ncbi:hypothetical protein GCM10010349_38150 [Streptomyces flavofungini]|nr:hypothetical protein GCM10010349_38150 [Streptomyces flavofungini]
MAYSRMLPARGTVARSGSAPTGTVGGTTMRYMRDMRNVRDALRGFNDAGARLRRMA